MWSSGCVEYFWLLLTLAHFWCNKCNGILKVDQNTERHDKLFVASTQILIHTHKHTSNKCSMCLWSTPCWTHFTLTTITVAMKINLSKLLLPCHIVFIVVWRTKVKTLQISTNLKRAHGVCFLCIMNIICCSWCAMM